MLATLFGIFIAFVVASAFTGYNIFPGFSKLKHTNNITNDNNYTQLNITPSIENLTINFPIYNEEENILFLELNKTEQFLNSMEVNHTEKPMELKCQEVESPVNIGAYEVPTERDLIILYRESLLYKLNAYHRDILNFLRDIKDVTKAAISYESRCKNRTVYRKCVRKISNQYTHAAKHQALTAEKDRHLSEPFIQGQICKISEIKTNPLELLKNLAVEKTILEFALPGFLRLLHECFNFCNKNTK